MKAQATGTWKRWLRNAGFGLLAVGATALAQAQNAIQAVTGSVQSGAEVVRIDFAQPWFLLALLLVVPAVWWARRSSGRVVFSSLRALPAGGHTWRTRIAWVPDALLGCAVAALVIGLAGPRADSPCD